MEVRTLAFAVKQIISGQIGDNQSSATTRKSTARLEIAGRGMDWERAAQVDVKSTLIQLIYWTHIDDLARLQRNRHKSEQDWFGGAKKNGWDLWKKGDR